MCVQLATDTVLNLDTLGRQGGKSDSDGGKLVIQQTANSVDDIKCLNLLTSPFLVVNALTYSYGVSCNGSFDLVLSPDPSTNHNVARRAQHKGTSVLLPR